jgi:hypothetical protein
VDVDDREAKTVTALGGRPGTTVIDTFGPYVLVVSARDGREALVVAAPNVR